MTIDDERTNWLHHEHIETDTTPMTSEGEAAARLVSLVATHLDRRYVTDRLLRDIAGKVVASRDVVRAIFDRLDADPNAIAQRDRVLRQQQTAALSDEDEALERAAHHKRGYEQAMRSLAAMGSVYAGSLVDRDGRAADEDSARIARERADEHAAAGMPRGMAS